MRKKISIKLLRLLAAIFGLASVASIAFAQSIPTISPWYYFGGSTRAIRTVSTSTIVVVGANATTTASIFQVKGNATITGLATTTANSCVTTNSAGTLGIGSCGVAGGGITSLNGQTGSTQTFSTSTTGSSFDITSTGDVHTLRIGTATSTATGLLTGADWTVFNNKLSAALVTLNGQTGATQTFATSSVGSGFTLTSSGNTHTLAIGTATSTTTGLLTGADWTAFNAKLSAAVISLNGLTGATQTFASSTTGTDFSISSSGTAHTFNLPTASASNRGLLSTTDWSAFNAKLSSAIQTLGGVSTSTISLAGTANRVTVSTTTNSITLSGPQDIHTAATPTFGGITINGVASSTELRSPSSTLDKIVFQSATSTTNLALSYGTASRCLRLDANKNIVAASADCTAGDTGITTLNTLTGASQTFASSTTGTDFSISSATTVHTFNLPSSSGSNRGLLAAADWTTFNSKLSAAVVSLNGLTGATQTFATSTAGSDINIASSGTTHTFNFPETSSSTRGVVASSTYASIAKKRFDFYLEQPTATEDIALMTFDATSTILKVYGVNKTNSDTVTFNLFHAASRAQSTSTAQAVFSAYQTNTATTTPTSYTSFASSTVSTGSVLKFNTSAASSTQFMFTIYYREGS